MKSVAWRFWPVDESANPEPARPGMPREPLYLEGMRPCPRDGGHGSTHRLAVFFSQSGSLNTQNEPPWATGLVSTAMSPPHSGTAPP